jgi:hypothetical protein
MTIPPASDSALVVAHQLVDMGVPVFAARLNADGTPDRQDRRWQGYQKKVAGARCHASISGFKDGEALCAVTGVVFDVIDHDLQNDPSGLALKQMSEDLGDFGPEVYLETRTPSGGTHLWVVHQDIGTHPGFRKGLDYKGGNPDGSSRGFVFLPPTIRRSKRDGQIHPYEYRSELTRPDPDDFCQALCDYVLAGRGQREEEVERPAREEVDRLRMACVAAEAGGQRAALLRYVHELERKGYARTDILRLLKSLKLPAYNPRRPWRERDFMGLFHQRGTIIPDAIPGELDGIDSIKRVTSDAARWLREITPTQLKWLAAPLFPFGCLVIIDGDPGIGKSVLTLAMMCRASRGEPIFPGDPGMGEPINCAIVGAEDDLSSVVIPRILANGGDIDRFVTMPVKRKRGGGLELLTFPDGVNKLEAMLAASGARFCTIDPISSFLGEDISSHNDASVRRALQPVVEVAQRQQCCIFLVRHLNKDNSMKAMYRGGGSIAFSGIARSGLIAGTLPDGSGYGIAQVKSSNAEGLEGCLAYTIDKQTVKIPGSGVTEMPLIRWLGQSDYTADDLVRGEDGRNGNGRAPIQQQMVEECLLALIQEYGGSPIPAGEALAYIKADGCSTSPIVLAKAREAVGLRSVPQKSETGRMQGWAWIYG